MPTISQHPTLQPDFEPLFIVTVSWEVSTWTAVQALVDLRRNQNPGAKVEAFDKMADP